MSPEQADHQRPRLQLWPALLVGLSVAALALLQAHPLGRFFDQGIPYGYKVVPGYEVVPGMPGDHLQFLYWCWLLTDNLFGPSAFLTNPYEFSTFLHPEGVAVYANFPFSLLYVPFSPLGAAPAYNLLVLASYALAGLAAFGLARELLRDSLAALPAGLIFALLPFRAAQALSGHLYGFVAFLLPLTLYCLERGWRLRSWPWGAGAGACVLLMGLLEPHLVYYTCLFLGLYVPLRLVTLGVPPAEPPEGSRGAAGAAGAAGAVGAGLGAGVMAWAFLVHRGAPPDAAGLGQAVAIYLVLALALWAVLSRLAAAVTSLSPGQARRVVGRGFAPLAGLALYGAQPWLDLPHLGLALAGLAAAAGLWLAGPALWRARRAPSRAPGRWAPVAGLAVGVALAAGRMLLVKASNFDQSIAGGGRGLDEILLFTPHLADLWNWTNPDMERLVHLGWVLTGLAGLGLALLVLGRPAAARQRGQAALWAFCGLVAALLSLGPTLDAAPLYRLLYRVVPFFEFPRVPGRLIIFAVLMLALVAGWALRETLGRACRRPWQRAALAGLVALAVVWDLGLPANPGICLLPQRGRLAAEVERHLATGPESGQRLLALPIWPGDSHQSSLYELMITRTRAKMVNGYSPVVPKDYREQVGRPLGRMNLGLLGGKEQGLLARLGVELVAFHEDTLLYTRKISPFPPALARERLVGTGAFAPLARQGNVFLWKRRPGPEPLFPVAGVTSPVTAVWEAEALPRETGELVEERGASGWGHLFLRTVQPGEPLPPRRPRGGGSLVRARAGVHGPGFLCFGPYRALPPGDYRARFRLRLRRGAAMPGVVEVVADQGTRRLAARELDGGTLPPDGAWHDVALEFSLAELTQIETRVLYSGRGELDLDVVLVDFAANPTGPGEFAASKLWRETGSLAAEPASPTGLVVRGRAGHHPPLNLMQGPQRTLEPGLYRALFRLALDGPAERRAPAVHLVAAADQGMLCLADRYVAAGELGPEYREVALEFALERRTELGFRVRLLGGASVRLWGARVERLPDRAGAGAAGPLEAEN